MSQITSLERKNKGKDIIDSELVIKLKDLSYRFLLEIAKASIKYKIVVENTPRKIAGHPTIYAINHYRADDTPVVCNAIKERCYILAGKQNLGFIDEAFVNMYGAIFVDRKNKEDMKLAKETMKKYLQKNRSIIYFPEGTWNLSDELLMLPMRWGIIEIAKDSNAQIIPTVLDYEDKVCLVKFASPLIFNKASKKEEEIIKLRDIMATLRWHYMERKTILERNSLNIEEARQKHKKPLNDYPQLNEGYEQSVIFNPHNKKLRK